MPEKLTPEQIKKVNQLQKNFSKGLIKAGVRGIRSAFKLNPKVVSYKEVKSLLNNLGFNSVSLSDEKYNVITWQDWLNIIKFDWENEKKWIADFYDCDNHAFHFSARMTNWFLVNTAGTAYGIIQKKYGHAFNVIVAFDENNRLSAYLYEPQTDGWLKIQYKGQRLKLTNPDWEYQINWIIMF